MTISKATVSIFVNIDFQEPAFLDGEPFFASHMPPRITAHPAAAHFGCFDEFANISATIMDAVFPDALFMVYT